MNYQEELKAQSASSILAGHKKGLHQENFHSGCTLCHDHSEDAKAYLSYGVKEGFIHLTPEELEDVKEETIIKQADFLRTQP